MKLEITFDSGDAILLGIDVPCHVMYRVIAGSRLVLVTGNIDYIILN